MILPRRGSRINGDQFSKQVPKAKASRGVRGMLPQIIFWTLKVHFLGSRDILKNLTDFRKTVETGVDPRLLPTDNKSMRTTIRVICPTSKSTIVSHPFPSHDLLSAIVNI